MNRFNICIDNIAYFWAMLGKLNSLLIISIL